MGAMLVGVALMDAMMVRVVQQVVDFKDLL